MEQDTITITKEEYEELLSLRETVEILEDKETMNSIKRSLREIEEGKEIPLSEL
jgi:PHD/YefM family antitoxin component YafN of YafNO toxin-antitoxin module